MTEPRVERDAAMPGAASVPGDASATDGAAVTFCSSALMRA